MSRGFSLRGRLLRRLALLLSVILLLSSLSAYWSARRAADEAYDRSDTCGFTSFVGYEWTASIGGGRNRPGPTPSVTQA